MKSIEVANKLGCQEYQIRKSKGAFRYHVSYFYKHGLTPGVLEDKVKAVFPEASIIESGDHFHAFVGGSKSGSSQDSFVWVRFTI